MSEFEQMRQRMAERERTDQEAKRIAAEERRLREQCDLSPAQAAFAARLKMPDGYAQAAAQPTSKIPPGANLTPGERKLAEGIVLPKQL